MQSRVLLQDFPSPDPLNHYLLPDLEPAWSCRFLQPLAFLSENVLVAELQVRNPCTLSFESATQSCSSAVLALAEALSQSSKPFLGCREAGKLSHADALQLLGAAGEPGDPRSGRVFRARALRFRGLLRRAGFRESFGLQCETVFASAFLGF